MVEFALEVLRGREYKPLAKIEALAFAASHRKDEAVLEAMERHTYLKEPDVLERLPVRITIQAKSPTTLPSNELFRAVDALVGVRREEAVAECAKRLRRAVVNRWERQERKDRGETFCDMDLSGWAQRDRLTKLLPLKGLDIKPAWKHISPRALVEAHYDPDIAPTPELWGDLPVAARAVWVHRALWSGGGLKADHPAREDETRLVVSLIGLYQCKPGDQGARAALGAALHNYLMEWLAEENAGPIDLRPLLPDCPISGMAWSEEFPNAPEVAHCEAMRRFTQIDGTEMEEADVAWCPRLKDECEQWECGSNTLWGSRLRPASVVTPDWKQASLVEIFARKRIHVPMKNKKKTYVLSISAYVNRLNEIRSLLKCKHCGRWLEPDTEYTKRYARYSETVFRCPDPKHRAEGRYFNHCWSCKRIIDSDVDEPVQRPRAKNGRWLYGYKCHRCGAPPGFEESSQDD